MDDLQQWWTTDNRAQYLSRMHIDQINDAQRSVHMTPNRRGMGISMETVASPPSGRTESSMPAIGSERSSKKAASTGSSVNSEGMTHLLKVGNRISDHTPAAQRRSMTNNADFDFHDRQPLSTYKVTWTAQAMMTILAALPVCRNGASTRVREVTTASLETGVRRRRESGGILAIVLRTMRDGTRCLKRWIDVVGARSWAVDFVEAK